MLARVPSSLLLVLFSVVLTSDGFYLNSRRPMPPLSRPPPPPPPMQNPPPPMPGFRQGPNNNKPAPFQSGPSSAMTQRSRQQQQRPPTPSCTRGRSKYHPRGLDRFSMYYPEAPRCAWPEDPMRMKKPPRTRRPSKTSSSGSQMESGDRFRPVREDAPMKLPTVQQIFVRGVINAKNQQQQQQPKRDESPSAPAPVGPHAHPHSHPHSFQVREKEGFYFHFDISCKFHAVVGYSLWLFGSPFVTDDMILVSRNLSSPESLSPALPLSFPTRGPLQHVRQQFPL